MVDVNRIRLAARVLHAANNGIRKGLGEPLDWLTLEHAPVEVQEDTIKGIQYVADNPSASPEDSHNTWLQRKIDAGWVYGPTKDVEAKTHPNIKPYTELDTLQKVKDYVFLAIAKEFLKTEES